MSDAYDKVKVGTYRDGSPMLLNKRTVAALDVVHEKLGYELTIVQGSYHKTTAASAGTHDGGGAVDLAPFEAGKKVHAMRAVGFAAWHRLPSQGDWPEHVHGILRGDREMSPEAAAQIVAYDNHRDGLADNAPDNTWHPDPKVTFDYPHYVRTHNMQLDDDLYPADPGNDTTIGVALRRADHLDEFRAAVAADFDTVARKFEAVNANLNGFQKQNTTRHAELEAKIDEVLTLLQQL
jgi:hypothetical protein